MRSLTYLASIVVLIAATAAEPRAQGVPPGPAPAPAAAPVPAMTVMPPRPPGVMIQQPPPPPREPRSFSLTISPVHLIFPIVELTGEVRVSDKLGLALIGAAGGLSVTSGSASTRFLAMEGGGSARYYVTGSFDKGIQIGAEALYVYVKTDGANGTLSTSAFASGLSIGPFVGYKWTGASGFTFDGQLGVAYEAVQAESGSATADAKRVYPLLNLNVGWSF